MVHPHSWISLAQHVRIVLDEYEVALHSPDQIAPVGVLHPTKFHLEVKSSGTKANLESFLTPVFEVTDDFNTEEETVMDGGDSPVKELPNGQLSEEVQSLVISQQHGLFTLGCWRQTNGKKLGKYLQSSQAYFSFELSWVEREGRVLQGGPHISLSLVS